MKSRTLLTAAAALTVLPLSALAHSGHHEATATFASGFLHPVTGLDHLLAMLFVGAWAMRLGGKSTFLLPTAFTTTLAAGWFAAVNGMQLPLVEAVILASIAVLGGLMLTFKPRSLTIAPAIAAAFAFFHGAAHGAEMPMAGSALQFLAGFILASLILQSIGALAMNVAERFFAKESEVH